MKIEFDKEKLIKQRAFAGLKQAELDKKLGVEVGRTAKYEGGHNSPRKTMIYKLADALGCEYKDLVNTVDNHEPKEIQKQNKEFLYKFFKDQAEEYFHHFHMTILLGTKSKLERLEKGEPYVSPDIVISTQILVAKEFGIEIPDGVSLDYIDEEIKKVMPKLDQERKRLG